MMASGGVPWTQVVTACIASAAFVLSIVGLVIQYRTWVTAGARLTARWRYGIAMIPTFNSYEQTDEATRTLTVEVTNRGRTVGEVQQITFQRDDAGEEHAHWFVLPDRWIAGAPGGAVPPHATRSWIVRSAALAEAEQKLAWSTVRPSVLLGDGKVLLLDPVALAGISAVSDEDSV